MIRLEYTLTIPNVTEKDSGEYECAVIPATGEDKEVQQVNVTVHGECKEIPLVGLFHIF